jgi:uncharacterized protein (TIGR03435 family)
MSRRLPACAFLAILAATGLIAQPRTAFEVTSVRTNTSGETRARMQMTPTGDFTAVNQPVSVLLTAAYQLPLFRIEGMPDWFRTERFDVSAKPPAGLTMEPFAEVRSRLLRSLLEDRFKLRAQFVTKDVSAMILTLARDDKRPGPQFRTSRLDCQTPATARGRGAGPVAPQEPVCAVGGGSFGTFCGRGATMAQVTLALSGIYQRPVVDATGLDGRFDFDMAFTPDNPKGPGVAFGSVCPTAQEVDRPALQTALQEQLGLRISSGRAPVEVLVIEGAERPAGN